VASVGVAPSDRGYEPPPNSPRQRRTIRYTRNATASPARASNRYCATRYPPNILRHQGRSKASCGRSCSWGKGSSLMLGPLASLVSRAGGTGWPLRFPSRPSFAASPGFPSRCRCVSFRHSSESLSTEHPPPPRTNYRTAHRELSRVPRPLSGSLWASAPLGGALH
jgi:hypothetical protein